MRKIDLAGSWDLSQDGAPPIAGKLPGCTYLDYIAAGMEDPFWGENETAANELAHHAYRYSRTFTLDGDELKAAHLELVIDGADTLCTITVNGQEAGRADNLHRIWRFDLRGLCREGTNRIDLDFADPYRFLEERQQADPLPSPMTPIPGVGHLRKANCHFGWDWGPKLPPAGVARSIGLEINDVRLCDFRVCQQHQNGSVSLSVSAKIQGAREPELSGKLVLTAPDGRQHSYTADLEKNRLQWDFPVEEPALWWCNGLGEQPLYQLEAAVFQNSIEADCLHRQIGLRTIELDTAPDGYGNQFRFIVNGVPIFVKGANWIPPDSFITRADRQTMDFYVGAARRANMNMLRVWGGGLYENEDFYDACDRDGILVWQDFAFACNPYPLYDEAYLANVRAEAEDNVSRLRSRASLALWCGNNECEVFQGMWKDERVKKSNAEFYHNTLRQWVEELDGITPYWPGSPSSGDRERKPHNMEQGQICGDTHLWQIWHGMLPIEAFRNYPTRFCSEFGMESMPSMHTVRSFADEGRHELFEPVMQLHQKSPGGNEKILYYLLAKYPNPAEFEDYVYLSQLVQAGTVRFATDCWRRNIGLQNGAIFWQWNDCWPVASWAGIDYGRQLKAVAYQARHFNQMLCLSNDYYDDRAELYITNEYPRDFSGQLEWELKDFHGRLISGGRVEASVGAVASKRIAILRFSEILRGRRKTDAVLEVRLVRNGETADCKSWLLVPDKEAALPKVQITHRCTETNGAARVELSAPAYARYVYVEADGVTAPWSDNFFDIPAGGSVTLTVPLPEGMSAQELDRSLRVKSLADVKPKNGRLKDRWLRTAMFMKKKNFLSWFFYKYILK